MWGRLWVGQDLGRELPHRYLYLLATRRGLAAQTLGYASRLLLRQA